MRFASTLLMLLPAFIAGWVYTGRLQQETESLVVSGLRARGELWKAHQNCAELGVSQ
jgi:hypothetical protein